MNDIVIPVKMSEGRGRIQKAIEKRKQNIALKADKFIETYYATGCVKTKTAEVLGVTPEAVTQRLRGRPAKDALERFFQKKSLRRKLAQVAMDGLDAKTIGKNGQSLPDHSVRHRFWRDMMLILGHLKGDGGQAVMAATNIHISWSSDNGVSRQK